MGNLRRAGGPVLIFAALVAVGGCVFRQTGPLAVAVRRIAVLPPCDTEGHPLPGAGSESEGLAEVLAGAARAVLARNGFAVIDPVSVELALKGRVPSSPADAAALARAGALESAVLFIRLDRWVPNPESTMRIDSVLVALDVTLLDQSGAVLWHAHRPLQPVPIYGALFIGQGYVVAADAVMAEVLGPLRPAA